MGPAAALLIISSGGLPRVSGDGPDDSEYGASVPTVAPRERGWALCEVFFAQ